MFKFAADASQPLTSCTLSCCGASPSPVEQRVGEPSGGRGMPGIIDAGDGGECCTGAETAACESTGERAEIETMAASSLALTLGSAGSVRIGCGGGGA